MAKSDYISAKVDVLPEGVTLTPTELYMRNSAVLQRSLAASNRDLVAERTAVGEADRSFRNWNLGVSVGIPLASLAASLYLSGRQGKEVAAENEKNRAAQRDLFNQQQAAQASLAESYLEEVSGGGGHVAGVNVRPIW
jgi:hypothetical protein